MRPNQQSNNNNKNRQRSRNNNNGGRKHINPLSRNFESNGPDVKIRGNASHIAEKYLQLARDAQASGDSVMAENYLQHAEHYFRILSAAQPQGQMRSDQFNPDDGDDDDDVPPDRFSSPEPRINGYQQQPEPQFQPPPQPVAAESGEAAEVAAPPVQQAAGGEDGQAAAGEGEGEPRRHRERRRRRRAPGDGAPGSDPANAPQPDVGELPAFLTAGTTPAE